MKKILIALVAVLISVGQSCKKKSESFGLNGNSNPATAMREYSSSNYLSFSSVHELDSVLEVIGDMNPSERRAWENSYDDGFKSMQTIFEDHIRKDSIYEADVDSSLVSESTLHCPEIMSELGKMYYAAEQPEGGYFVTLNLYYPFLARVVNKFGVVKVGDHIFQFTKDYDKWISAGDETLVSQMLDATESTVVGTSEIIVRQAIGQAIVNPDIGEKTLGCNDPQPSWWSVVGYNWFATGYTTFGPSGKMKIEAKVWYSYSKVHNCNGMYTPRLYVEVWSYNRGRLGRWNFAYVDMTTNLSWTPNVPVNLLPGKVKYWANNNTHFQYNHLTFQNVSFSTYSQMFNPNNFYLYSTRSGGCCGGSTYCSH